MSRASLFDRALRVWTRTKSYHLPLWLLVHGIVLAFFVASFPFRVDTNLFSILPSASQDRELVAAQQRMSAGANSAFYVLFGHADFLEARKAARDFAAGLAGYRGITKLVLDLDTGIFASFRDYLFQNRYRILAPDVAVRLEKGDGASVAADALAEIYGPLSLGALDRVDADPFLLSDSALRSYLGSGLLGGMAIGMKDGVLAAQSDGKWYVLVSGSLAGDGMDSGGASGSVRAIREAAARAEAGGAEVIYSGVPFHSYESASRAQAQIAVISSVSLLAVIIMLVWAFASALPLLATIGSLAVGTGAALAATIAVFGDIHIFTLVFGTSLIGTSVDYAIHWFSERQNPDEPRDGAAILGRVLPGVTLGLVTTLVGYAALVFSGILLVQQMAVFSIVGLLSSFLTELLLFPMLRAPKSIGRPASLGASDALIGAYRRFGKLPRAGQAALLLALAIPVALGLWKVRLSNDLADLYTMTGRLASDEAKSAKILGLRSTGMYLMARAESAEKLLGLEESFAPGLERLEAEGRLGSHISLSMLLPSRARQSHNYELVGKVLMPRARDQAEALGLGESGLLALRSDFAAQAGNTLGPEEFLRQPFSSLAGNLWLGRVDKDYFSVVMPFGVGDAAALRELAASHPGVSVVDTAGDLSAALQHFSVVTLWLVAVAYFLIFGLLAFRYGPRVAIFASTAPVAASVVAIAALGLTGLPFNLFAVVALVLVLGGGVDYSIFYLEGSKHRRVTMLGVILAAATTLLSYGALALTDLPPARVFGFTLAVGIFFSFVFAPAGSAIARRFGGTLMSRRGLGSAEKTGTAAENGDR